MSLVMLFICVASDKQSHMFLILSGPSQSSTLIADIVSSLPGMNTDRGTLKVCGGAAEIFNPMCGYSAIAVSCFGSQAPKHMGKIWIENCTNSTQFISIHNYIKKKNISFGKENFSPTKMQKFIELNYTLMVAWRPPWNTFPAPFWRQIHNALCDTINLTRSDLSILRNWATNNTCTHTLPFRSSKQASMHKCGDVIAHYIFFYSLITDAWKYNVSVINMSDLLQHPDEDLPAYVTQHFPSRMLQVSPDAAFILSNATRLLRQGHVHGHAKYASIEGRSNITSQIYNRKQSLFAETGCGSFLRAISRWCADLIVNCDRYNAYYGVDRYFSDTHNHSTI